MRRKLLLVLSALALLAGACSESEGNDAASEATTSESEESAESNTGDDNARSASVDGELSVEEIAELLFPDFDEASIADQEAEYEAQERERQQLIVECMAEQGFEYQPVSFDTFDSVSGFDDEIDPTSREWAETYGFGITTFDTTTDFAADEELWVDPNEEYVSGLSESARNAYYDALYGVQPEIDPTLSDEEVDALFEENPDLWGPSGCEGEAWEATDEFTQLNEVYFSLGDEFDELYQRVEADPRIAELEQEWVECMAEKGHGYSSQQEMWDDIFERSQVLYDFDDPFAGMTQEEIDAQFDSLSDAELNELFAGPEPDPELLAEIQDFEIALAVDAFDCGAAEQFELFEEVFADYQDEFIEENLDVIRAALASDE